jgi:F0F1-type ATP synthase delta subunit
MREPTIARNYAETLLELAQRAGDLRGWGEMIDSVGNAMETDRRLRGILCASFKRSSAIAGRC